jgi:hypothetical protein
MKEYTTKLAVCQIFAAKDFLKRSVEIIDRSLPVTGQFKGLLSNESCFLCLDKLYFVR